MLRARYMLFAKWIRGKPCHLQDSTAMYVYRDARRRPFEPDFDPEVSTPKLMGPDPRMPSTEIRHRPGSGSGTRNDFGLVSPEYPVVLAYAA